MANKELQVKIDEWEKATHELASAFSSIDTTQQEFFCGIDLLYQEPLQIVFPYNQEDGSSIDLIVKSTYQGTGDASLYLDLYKRYLDYANGPGKNRHYYAFIADMPGMEKGYWFNKNGPLTVLGEFLGYMTRLDASYFNLSINTSLHLPFILNEEPKQLIVARLYNNRSSSIEGKLNNPDIIRNSPELFNLLKLAEQRR